MVAALSQRKIALQFSKVDKRYGPVYALRDLNLAVAAGECVALTGRNGSGKTTLLRIAARLTRPSRGEFSLADDVRTDRSRVGFVAHSTMLYDELSAQENLLFFARMLGVAHSKERVARLLADVGLSERRDSLLRTFSRGMRQRVAIARALLGEPSLLLFDEPGSGLDPEAAAWLAQHLRELRDQGATILLSLHGESEVARLATRAVRLDAGSLVADTGSGASFASVFSFAGG
jgi:heme exporter protein A